MELPPASAEQLAVVESVLLHKNVMVAAVAGSGKTTTMMHIAKAVDQRKRILIISYNARLKDETRAKIRALGIHNTEAHSYHAFGVKYYGSACRVDRGIQDVVLHNTKPVQSFWFDYVILDEVQDQTDLYRKFVRKILNDMEWSDDPFEPLESFGIDGSPEDSVFEVEASEITFGDSDNEEPKEESPKVEELEEEEDFSLNSTMPSPKALVTSAPKKEGQIKKKRVICLFGDPSQNIYAFKDADDRFLMLADKIWAASPDLVSDWAKLPLRQSFRITAQMADFVNRVCLGDNRIIATRQGPKVKYMICNAFGPDPANALRSLLQVRDAKGALKYKPSDVFVVAPSVRSSTNPIKKLELAMVEAKYPVFVPVGDDEVLKPEIINGKMVFSSIHQTKGLERRIVMLFGFDESYFKFFNKDASPDICPNEIYVAITRARDELILIHHSSHKYMPFLNSQLIPEVCALTTPARFDPKIIAAPERSKFGVSELTRHLTLDTIDELLKLIPWVELNQADRTELVQAGLDFRLQAPISIPLVVAGSSGNESICDINGVCLPAIYEHRCTGHSSIAQYVLDNLSELPKSDRSAASDLANLFFSDSDGTVRIGEDRTPSIANFLQLSTIYNALQSGYIFKTRQLNNFDWLAYKCVNEALGIVRKYIPRNARYEVPLQQTVVVNDAKRTISGRIDALVRSGFRSGGPEKEGDIGPNDTVQIWEFKCVGKLLPEHILQLAQYAWLFQKTYPMVRANYYLLNILDDTLLEIVISPYSLDALDAMMHKLITEKTKSRKRSTDAQFLASLI